jgi:hypothetical protein
VSPSHTLAYIAGIIDGDGYISITRVRAKRNAAEYFGAQIGIAGTRREPHDLASSLWGGKVACYAPVNPHHRPQYQWSRVGHTAVTVITAIYPYLLIKREHAELALELHAYLEEARSSDPFPWFGPDYDPVVVMRRMRDEMIDLNQSRRRVRKEIP